MPRFIAFLKSASNPVAPYTKNDPRTYTKDEVTHITDLLRSGSCGLACGAELLETLDRNFYKKDILAFMPQMERLIDLNSKKNSTATDSGSAFWQPTFSAAWSTKSSTAGKPAIPLWQQRTASICPPPLPPGIRSPSRPFSGLLNQGLISSHLSC